LLDFNYYFPLKMNTNKIATCFSLIIVLVFAVTIPSHAQSRDSTAVYAFHNITVIPMDENRVLADQTVLVRGDRIIEIGSSSEVNIPGGATQIDGNGKYLMPGLAEMHGHIPPPNLPDDYPESYIEDVLFLYLAGGITTVRGMLGHDGQLEIKRKIDDGTLLGPSLYLAGPSFNGNSISSVEQAVQKVKRQKEEGWYLLKIHPGLSRGEYDAMASTAHEANIPFGGHIPEEVGLVHALEMKQQTIDHLDGYMRYLDAENKPMDSQELEKAVKLSKESGTWVVPTMALWETLIGAADYDAMRQYPELKYMPDAVLKQWDQALEQFQSRVKGRKDEARQHAKNRLILLKALHDAGVPVLMGTDSPQIYSVPGFSLLRELELMKKSGMNNFEILQTGTANVGKYFNDTDDFGTIAPGQRADLLLLDENPLEDLQHLKNFSGIMVRGQWISRETIDDRLQSISSSN
jgi:imidazolonepropionase-like amidohydrolase